MDADDLRIIVCEEILNIAPEAELDGLDPQEDLRDALDLDSMDMLNIITALHERLGVDIPEANAGEFVTLRGAVEFLKSELA